MFSNDSFILRRVRFPDILQKTGDNKKHNSNQAQAKNSGSTRGLSCFCRSSLELMMVLLLSFSILLRHKHVLISSMDYNLFIMPLKKNQPYPPGKLRSRRTKNQSGQSQILPAVVKGGKTLPSNSQRLCHFLCRIGWNCGAKLLKPIKPTYKILSAAAKSTKTNSSKYQWLRHTSNWLKLSRDNFKEFKPT